MELASRFRHGLSFLAFLALLCLSPISLAIDTQFLDDSVNSDGSISRPSDSATAFQSTAESLFTYKLLSAGAPDVITSGTAFLQLTAADDSTENISLLALGAPRASAAQASALAKILPRQNHDGGFGAFPGYESDVLSTAYALHALSASGMARENISLAVQYLLSKQLADGSWSLPGNSQVVETSALVLHSLWLERRSYQINAALTQGVQYLESQLEGDLWPSTEQSALALYAIINYAVDRSPYADAISRFGSLQLSNGSFNQDTFLTALGLRVLAAAQRPAADEIAVSGVVVNGDSGTPLSGVTVRLDGANSYVGTSNGIGEFSIRNLNAGRYSVKVEKPGFNPLSMNTLLTVGSKVELGTLQLSPQVDDPDTGEPVLTGFMRGAVTDRRTGDPIAGAKVSVDGQGLATNTNNAGVYQLAGIAAGSVAITVTAEGYSGVTGTADIEQGQTLLFSPALQQVASSDASLHGEIKDRSSSPIAGVEIVVTVGADTFRSATSSNGTYILEGIPFGDWQISVSAEGYHPVSVSTNTQAGASVLFSPTLDAVSDEPQSLLGGVTGLVVDAVIGRGIASATVAVEYTTGERVPVTSGADGEWLLEDLPTGTVNLVISADGYRPVTAQLDIKGGLVQDLGSISLDPETDDPVGVAFGYLRDVRTQDEVAGAVIAAINDVSGDKVEAISDAEGDFELPALTSGEYELIVTAPGYNEARFSIVMQPGQRLDLGEVRLRAPGVDALLPDIAILEMNIGAVVSDPDDFALSGSITGTAINRGNAAVEVPITIYAFEDIDLNGEYSDSDTLLGQAEFASSGRFGVDETAAFTIDVQGVQTFRDAPIHLWLDSHNVLAELSEANNSASTAGLCINQQKPSVDLALCMDSSGSVSASDFRLQLEGTARAIEDENVVPRDGSVRISALQFASSAYVELQPTIIEEDNVLDVADAIRSIRKNNGGTSIHSCINTAASLITAANPASALQVIDVSTDGQSSRSAAVSASNAAQERGVDVLNAIGVGSGIDTNLLNDIVFPKPAGGERGFVVTVDGYDEYIEAIANKIQRETRIADITLGGLSLSDNGSTLSAEVILGNAGASDITEALVVKVFDSQDLSTPVAQVNYTEGLSSGSSTTVTVAGLPGAAFTSGELVATVELGSGAQECNSANNRQSAPVTSLVGGLELAVNSSAFGPQSEVQLTSTVVNTGSIVGNYTVDLEIVDSTNATVYQFPASEVSDLPVGGQEAIPHSWNTGLTMAGQYIARAVLSDAEGNALSTAEAAFTISEPEGTVRASLRLSTNRSVYHVTDQVRLEGLAQNLTTIHAINSPRVELSVRTPANETLYTASAELASLAPGQVAEVIRTLVLDNVGTGTYQASAVLLGASAVTYATGTATFDVVNDVRAAVTGDVVVQSPALERGESQVCEFRVLNSGAETLSGINLQLLAVSPETETVMFNSPVSLDLEPKASATYVETVSTRNYSEGTYACVLQATLEGEPVPLDSASFTVKEPPISFDSQLVSRLSPNVLVLVDNLDEDEPFGPDGAITVSKQADFLAQQLNNLHVGYRIVDSQTAFVEALLTGDFNQYMLLSEQTVLNEQTQFMISRGVWLGHGLMATGAFLTNNTGVAELAGVALAQHTPDALSVQVAGDGYSSGTASLTPQDVQRSFHLQGASLEGGFILPAGQQWQYDDGTACRVAPQAPALTHYLHGAGSTVAAGFDWLLYAASNAEGAFAQWLAEAIAATAPNAISVAVGESIPFTFAIYSETGGAGRVILRLPSDITLRNSEGWIQINDTQWQAPFSVAADGRHEVTGSLAVQSDGQFQFEVDIEYGEPDDYQLYESHTQSVTATVVPSLPDLLSQLAAAIVAHPLDPWLRLAEAELSAARDAGSSSQVLRRLEKADRLLDKSDAATQVLRQGLASNYLQRMRQGG